MVRIESFNVDHRKLLPGIYVSRTDGDIVTYDLRMCIPNSECLLTNSQMHSFEHMLATYLRNGPIADRIIYVGPMGCQTGFYVLVRMNDNNKFLSALIEALKQVILHEGEIFGKSEKECGNYKNLSLAEAKAVASAYLDILNNGKNDFLY